MTREEAIAYFESRRNYNPHDGDPEAERLALAALRAQQVQESKPLTLDELRHMDGEPVWIVWLDGRINSKWWIVGNYDWHMMEFDDDYERYGKTWLAYSHQLKNTTEG